MWVTQLTVNRSRASMAIQLLWLRYLEWRGRPAQDQWPADGNGIKDRVNIFRLCFIQSSTQENEDLEMSGLRIEQLAFIGEESGINTHSWMRHHTELIVGFRRLA